jgi:hypothetical protein
MLKRAWMVELSEEARYAWTAMRSALRSFWTLYVWPVLMTFWVFFALVAPMLVVILILWYLDSIGWRSGNGFYTIGAAAGAHASSLLG